MSLTSVLPVKKISESSSSTKFKNFCLIAFDSWSKPLLNYFNHKQSMIDVYWFHLLIFTLHHLWYISFILSFESVWVKIRYVSVFKLIDFLDLRNVLVRLNMIFGLNHKRRKLLSIVLYYPYSLDTDFSDWMVYLIDYMVVK